MGDRASLAVITVPEPIVTALRAHSENESPNEACGLLAGTRDRVTFFYPLTNVAASTTRYTVDPIGHIGALRHAERSGWHLTGVFHSHPAGPASPSEIDIEGALESEWIHVIHGSDAVRAWRIRTGNAVEVPLRFES